MQVIIITNANLKNITGLLCQCGKSRGLFLDSLSFCFLSLSTIVYLRVKVNVTQSCTTLCDPMDCNTPGVPLHIGYEILQARLLEWVAVSFCGNVPNLVQGLDQVFLIAGRFLLAESLGKTKNTGVSSLALLQWIFPSQEYFLPVASHLKLLSTLSESILEMWGGFSFTQSVYTLSYQFNLLNMASVLSASLGNFL